MNKKNFILLCGNLANAGNIVLNKCINVVLILILLFGLYALWDTWAIFQGASVSSSLLIYKPELNPDQDENPSIIELMALYPDVCAWITIEDTNIDYPVVQGEDNNEYVNTNVEGDFSLSGAIFLDYLNSNDFSDLYNILHGHHMEFNAMFGGLDLFKDEEYLNEHTLGYLFLEDTTIELEIFAYISVDAYDSVIFTVNSGSEVKQEILIEYIEENASVYRDIEIENNDQIIAFSTCSSAGTNARTIVFAKYIN